MTVNHGLLYALGEIGWVGIMPEFAYKARNAQGGLVEGVLNCPDRGVAIRQIEQQNCIPIRIDPVMTTAPATAVPTAPSNFVPKILTGSPLNVLIFQRKPLRFRTIRFSSFPSHSRIFKKRA